MPAKKKIKVQDLKPKKDAKGGVIATPGHDNAGSHKPLNIGTHGSSHGSTHGSQHVGGH